MHTTIRRLNSLRRQHTNNPMNLTLVLAAIATVESCNNDDAIGRLGERSRYQIRPHLWRMFTASRLYSDYKVSTLVASNLCLHILSSLPASHRTIRDLAVCWNWGFTHYANVHFAYGNVPPSVKKYANKICTAYHRALLTRSVSKVRRNNSARSTSVPPTMPTPNNIPIRRDGKRTSS
jgi:hypothetical protein